MGIFKDIKKALKGSKEYQKRKKGKVSKAVKSVAGDVKKAVKGSKKFQKRKKGPISKAVKQVAKDVKSAVKGSGDYQFGVPRGTLKTVAPKKAKTKKGPVYKSKKDYSKAGSPKKTPKFGEAFSSARKAGKKTFTWKGKSYTTKTADDAKKVAPKPKSIAKPKAITKAKPKAKVKEPIGQSYEVEEPIGQSYEVEEKPKPKYPPATKASRPPRKFKYEGGGKVDSSGLFSFPSTDARKRGK